MRYFLANRLRNRQKFTNLQHYGLISDVMKQVKKYEHIGAKQNEKKTQSVLHNDRRKDNGSHTTYLSHKCEKILIKIHTVFLSSSYVT